MRTLITGASGFVGGSLRARLDKLDDFEVHGIGRRPLAHANYTSIDLSRRFDLEFTPDVVIHAAARATPWGRDDDFRRDNVEATRNVIELPSHSEMSR